MREEGEERGEERSAVGYSGEERRGEPSFGRRSDDTAHPSWWQVPAVAPLQRTQANREREQHYTVLIPQTQAAGKEIKNTADCLI